MTFAVRGLDHVVLRTPDMPRALRFWQEVIGCREERRVERLGLIQLRAGTSMIDLVPADAVPVSGQGNVDHVALRIEPFDEAAIRAHLARHGIAAGEAVTRYGAEGDGPSIYLQDPDGNTIELKGPGNRPVP